MNKELTPLETLKLLKDFVLGYADNGLDRVFIGGCCDIIETALKALEIIKERNIDVCLIKNTKNYDEYCNEFVMKVLALKDEKFFVENKGITQEEYDLLKEALL